MDKISKRRKLPERLRLVRDGLVNYTHIQRPDLTYEEVGLIFGISKGRVSYILDDKGRIIK